MSLITTLRSARISSEIAIAAARELFAAGACRACRSKTDAENFVLAAKLH